MFFDFPFALTKNLQPGGINHQVRDLTPGGGVTETNRPGPPADTGVIRASQRNPHQGKNGINKALCGTQGEPEYAFNHQNNCNGKIRITLRLSARCGRC